MVASVHHVVCKGTSDLRKRSPGVRQLAVVVALVIVAGGPVVWAQTTATIQGTISDGTGAPLPGVQVTVTGSQGSGTAITDPRGSYTVPGLPPGTYRMTASLNGFAPGEAEQIELAAGQTLTLNVTLESLTFGEEVLVTAGKRTQTLLEVPASITVLSGDTIEQNARGEPRRLRTPGARPEHLDRHRGRLPHHPARHQHRWCRRDGRGLRRRRAVRIEHRPGQRRGAGRRLRHLRHRADRGAARPAGHPLRGELARRRLQVHHEPAVDGGDRGEAPGFAGDRRGRRPRVLHEGDGERPRGREGGDPSQRVLPLRRRLHRLDRQQPDPQPDESRHQHRRRHACRGEPQLRRRLRRALRRPVRALG